MDLGACLGTLSVRLRFGIEADCGYVMGALRLEVGKVFCWGCCGCEKREPMFWMARLRRYSDEEGEKQVIGVYVTRIRKLRTDEILDQYYWYDLSK